MTPDLDKARASDRELAQEAFRRLPASVRDGISNGIGYLDLAVAALELQRTGWTPTDPLLMKAGRSWRNTAVARSCRFPSTMQP